MDDLRRALHRVADLIADYREGLPEQHVAPSLGRAAVRDALARELPPGPAPLDTVVDELVAGATPGLMASAGPRYFGFVIGGSPDAALAADLLTVGWDQCAYNEALSPAALAFEDVAGTWLKELLGLPAIGVGGLHDRWAGSEHRRAGRGALEGPRTGRLGRRSGRSRRCPARESRRERRASCHDRPEPSPPRARRERDRGDSRARERCHGHGRALARPPLAARCADDRLRPGREREHRSLRRPQRRHVRRCRGRGVGARRWCLRALGRSQPGDEASRRRNRGGGLVGVRRPQVAERAVRLRIRVLCASGRPCRSRWSTRPRTSRAGRRPGLRRRRFRAGVVAPGTRVRRVGRAPRARPIGRRRSDRALVRARPPCRAAPRSPRRRRRSSTRSCSTRYSYVSEASSSRTGSSGSSSRTASAGSARRPGAASASFGSRCRTGRRPSTTSTAPSTRLPERALPRLPTFPRDDVAARSARVSSVASLVVDLGRELDAIAATGIVLRV